MKEKKKTKAKLSWKRLLTAAILSSSIGLGTLTITNLPTLIGEKVVEVVDGDTFIIQNRQPIRLYSVDAPEIEHCLGKEAKAALTALILNKRVIIKEPLSDGRGRVMALVYINGKLVNEIMIRAGLVAYHYQGGSEKQRLHDAHIYALENAIGIHSPTCILTEPPSPTCTIKANHDERKNIDIYFRPDCNFYSLVQIQAYQGDMWVCSEEEAQKAGFTLSPDCE